jgi:ArsR family transcriptional regulator, arsenate/arsenite/antimonite-responsive transcriptional repressor
MRGAAGCGGPTIAAGLRGDHALRLAEIAKALGDPTRLVILDALRKVSPEAVCQCELLPLFEISQPALAKHLKVLVAAGLLRTERRGLWAFYYFDPESLRELHAWLD